MGRGGDGAVTEPQAATARAQCPAWGQAARSSQVSCCREQATGEWGEGSLVGTHGWMSCPEQSWPQGREAAQRCLLAPWDPMSQDGAACPVPSKKCFTELFVCSSLFLKHKGIEMPPGDVPSAQMDGCWWGSRAEGGGNGVLRDLPLPSTSPY